MQGTPMTVDQEVAYAIIATAKCMGYFTRPLTIRTNEDEAGWYYKQYPQGYVIGSIHPREWNTTSTDDTPIRALAFDMRARFNLVFPLRIPLPTNHILDTMYLHDHRRD